MNAIELTTLAARSLLVGMYARKQGLVGHEFGDYGRRLGLRLLISRRGSGISYILTPVNIVRYFEFPFVLSELNLPASSCKCLDISSPRLFSIYVAENYPSTKILMANPDNDDLSATEMVISTLGYRNISTFAGKLDQLAELKGQYSFVWAISVIEHIAGDYDDRDAVKMMMDLLAPGGKLILTVPVDKGFRVEYRNRNYYGTQPTSESQRFFFQRVYDKTAIFDRLVRQTKEEPVTIRWFGELEAGRFQSYIKEWLEKGNSQTVNDPLEILNHYQEYPTWEDMPGMGVCGLAFRKTNPPN